MIEHKHVHDMIILIVVISTLICIGGIFTGFITQDELDLKNNPKIEKGIVDKIQEEGHAEVIVMLKSPSENREIQSEIPEFEINYEYSNIHAISGELDMNILNLLKENSQVEKIYLNKIYKVDLDDSLPLIEADKVHQAEKLNAELKGKGYSVCVIDTGVDYTHPALAGRVISGYDYVNNDSDPIDDHGHGTHVAGIIASNDATYTGVAPEANIVAVKSCGSNGECTQANILAGIDWCVGNASLYNITVISMSLGNDGEYDDISCPNDFDASINSAISHGIFVTISSGNNGHDNGISSPACSANATSVAATDKSDYIWGGSNTGGVLDLLAPGVDIRSSVLGGGFGDKEGTSMANAHVAGAAILIYQNINLSGESITPLEIQSRLKNTGVNITDADNGLNFSRINVQEAVLKSELGLFYRITPYPKTNANISFYANYTNRTSKSPINSATCKIDFESSSNNLMNWNASASAYQYNRNFTSPLTYQYNVTCNHSDFETLKESSDIEVVQGSENCTYPGSNINWDISTGEFSRCIGENIVINRSNVTIRNNAQFYLKDTNFTLVGDSASSTINVTSSDANFSVENAIIRGMDTSSKRLDVEIYGYGDIYNSTFENSRLIIRGGKDHVIENSTFKYYAYFNENSNNHIKDSVFESQSFFQYNSVNTIENSSFENRFYIRHNASVEVKNCNSSGDLYLQENSIINFSILSNLTSSLIVINNPRIYGRVDMPNTVTMLSDNLTRDYPLYVYYTGTTTPYPNKQVNVTDSNGNLIWQGTTNSQGYVEVNLTLNTTNYGTGNFTVSTNSSSGMWLLANTPITLEAAGSVSDGEDNEGSSSCTEKWNCTELSDCEGGFQNRACVDLNDCGTELHKPNASVICFIPEQKNETEGNNGGGSVSCNCKCRGRKLYPKRLLFI